MIDDSRKAILVYSILLHLQGGAELSKKLFATGIKNMSNQWFKFYGGEYLSDAKIGRLSAAERSCWVTLLSMASMTDDGVIKFLEVDDLLKKSGIQWNPYNEGDWELCQSILIKLSNMNMIDVNIDKSEITLTNWKKRQEYSMTSTERSRKYREKQKENQEMQRNATESNGNATLEENRREENRIDNRTVAVSMLKESKKTKTNRLNTGYSYKFESFWSAYPNKVAKGKAYEVFQLLTEELQTECVNAINKQVENNHFWLEFANNGNGADQPPHPTTWLNQKRWEDDVVLKNRVGRNSAQQNSKANGVLKFS